MKFQLFFSFFIFSITTSIACICDPPTVTDKYMRSDFVAKIRIVKNYETQGEEELYKADIVIERLYKGEYLDFLFVEGYNSYDEDAIDIGSSCAIFIKEGTELIAYASKDEKGRYRIGMCSGLLYLDGRTNLENEKRELAILETFKEKNITYTNKLQLDYQFVNLRNFKGLQLSNDYAIYELTFSPSLEIKNVTEIKGFDNPIDKKLLKIVKNMRWRAVYEEKLDTISEDFKFLFGIYYYSNKEVNKSFLSSFYY